MRLPRITAVLQHRAALPRWEPAHYQSTVPRAARPKFGMERSYETVRAVLRGFNAASLVKIAFDTLWRDARDLRTTPWTTLLLVKWALQDRAVSLRLGPDLPGPVFDALREMLWDMPGMPERTTRIPAVMRSFAPAQVGFQESPGACCAGRR